MNHLLLILLVAAITFISRITFFRTTTRPLRLGHFLDVFPVALFVAIAAIDLIAPQDQVEITPYLAALFGGAAIGLWLRRSMLAVVGGGVAAYWLVRLLVG